MPRSVLGFTHQGKKTPADRKFEPELVQGSIFMKSIARTWLGVQAGAAAHQGENTAKRLRQPILNEKGNVVASMATGCFAGRRGDKRHPFCRRCCS